MMSVQAQIVGWNAAIDHGHEEKLLNDPALAKWERDFVAWQEMYRKRKARRS